MSLLLAFAILNGSADTATLEQTSGGFAVRSTDKDDWKFRSRGDDVSLPADIRTGTVGRHLVTVGKLQIDIAANSSVRISDGTIELRAGTIRLATDRPYAVRAGKHRVDLEPGSAGVCSVTSKGLIVQLNAGQGTVDDTELTRTEAQLFTEDAVQKTEFSDPFANRPQGTGQLVVRDPQKDSSTRLNLVRYHVNVVLMPPVALVQIDQAFYNPYRRMEEGTFVFNLPAGASVSRFAMFTAPDRLVEGELIERKRASNIYESIVRRKRDPAILEQIGDNLFRMRVFPVFARDTKRVLLDYTVPLQSADGKYSFKLPLVTDLKPIQDFRITGSIRPPCETKSVSTNQSIDFKPEDDGRVTFDWKQTKFKPDSDFHLQFRQPKTGKPIIHSWQAEEGQKEWYHAITIPQSIFDAQEADDRPVDLMVIADTSDRGRKYREQILRLTRQALGQLKDDDHFTLVGADVGYRRLVEWSKVEECDAAVEVLSKQIPMGESLLNAVTRAARQMRSEAPRGDRRRVAIYIGAGVNDGAAVQHVEEELNEKDIHFSAVLLKTWADEKPMLEWLATSTCLLYTSDAADE